MRLYVAAPLFTKPSARLSLVLARALEAEGHQSTWRNAHILQPYRMNRLYYGENLDVLRRYIGTNRSTSFISIRPSTTTRTTTYYSKSKTFAFRGADQNLRRYVAMGSGSCFRIP